MNPEKEGECNSHESGLSAIANSKPGLSITNRSLNERQRIYMYMFRVSVPSRAFSKSGV